MLGRRLVATCLAVGLAAAACATSGDGGADAAPTETVPSTTTTGGVAAAEAAPLAYVGYESGLYADDANWLCRPDDPASACIADLDATIVNADGSTQVEHHEPADDAPIDCFYIYPTVTSDAGANSDLTPGPSEVNAAVNQVARLDQVCDVYAPTYRQFTPAVITGAVTGDGAGTMADAAAFAYTDVVDAFKQYIAQDNDGRGFVLVGHSQGSSHLTRLIADEIDDDPVLRDHLVSAVLLGSVVATPEGEDVGGAFQHVPLCRSDGQTGCVINYSSFRSTAPPPAGSFFGRVGAFGSGTGGGAGTTANCTNPASLDSSEGEVAGELKPYFSPATVPPFTDPSDASGITTPFATYPGLLTAECVMDGGFTYLEVTVHGDPADPRADDIPGDLGPQWGSHLVDMNIAMGNIVDRVQEQADTYLADA